MFTALPRFDVVRTPADKRAVSLGYYFDWEAADRVARFFGTFLRHTKNTVAVKAGSPFILLPWQWEDLIAPLFGWMRPDGTRRFREAYVEIAKKGGKSTLAAGLALYMLMADREPSAEVYSAAADRNQASIVYREACAMVDRSAALKQRLWPVPSKKELVYGAAQSFWQVLSREAGTKEGFNIHCLIFDEFHAQPDAKLYDALKYGGASRRQPLFFYITTAGYDRESVCYRKHEYAKQVMASDTDLEFLGYVRGAEETDDITDPATWRKANPSLGVTVDISDFERAVNQVKGIPSEENSFKRYRLNIWTSVRTQWLPVERWDACKAELPELRGAACFGGLDLAATRDINALSLWFPEQRYLLQHYWVPRGAISDRQRQQKTNIASWCEQGLITITDGDAADYDQIENDVLEIAQKYDLKVLGVDMWNSLQVVQHLMNEGIEIAKVGQGFQSLSPATKLFERLVVLKELHHCGDPVTRWMFENIIMKVDAAENIKPDRSATADKIDGIVALIMSLATWMADLGPSAFETQGLVYA